MPLRNVVSIMLCGFLVPVESRTSMYWPVLIYPPNEPLIDFQQKILATTWTTTCHWRRAPPSRPA